MFDFVVTDMPLQSDIKVLEDGIAEHAETQGVPRLTFSPLVILKHDTNKKIVAGLYGKSFWNWLYVDSLWVQNHLRKSGLGRALMQAAENEAKRRGCIGAYLTTQSFDAPDFYRKLGYREFAQLSDFPKSHARFYFIKRWDN